MGIFLLREWLYNHSHLGVPLDDTWIHYRFASNLIQGNGFVYNINEPVSGSTSPFWVILLAGIYLFSGEFLISSKILSGLFFLFTAVGIYFFALKFGNQRKIAFLAALLTMIAGRFAWSALSGMEVTFFTFLSIMAVMKHYHDKEINKHSISAPVLFGLASLARPEGYALFAFAILDNFMDIMLSANRNIKATFTKIPFVQISIYLLIVSPYLIFSLYTTGRFLPQTFYAQNELFGLVSRLDYLKLYLVFLWDDNPLLFFFIPLGMGIVFQRAIEARSKKSFCKSQLILLWTIGYPLFAMLITPNVRHYHRYMMPLIPFYILVSLFGFNLFSDFLKHYFNRFKIKVSKWNLNVLSKQIPIGYLVLIIVVQIYLINLWSKKFAWDVNNINNQQVAMGKWVKENIPEDRVLALSDIGAITYVSGRRKIIDMVGLVNPELLSFTRKANKKDYQEVLLDFLSRSKPDYIITYPHCYPWLIGYKKVFLEVHSLELDHYSGITAGREMVVYKTYWDNFVDRKFH